MSKYDLSFQGTGRSLSYITALWRGNADLFHEVVALHPGSRMPMPYKQETYFIPYWLLVLLCCSQAQ